MRKGILLLLSAAILLAVTVFAIWYINESGKMHTGSRDSFVPANSALIIRQNSALNLSPDIEKAFGEEIRKFRGNLLCRVADSLAGRGYANPLSRILAVRIEGKNSPVFLYVMDSRNVLSRGETCDFLFRLFPGGDEKGRKYDGHRIYTLKQGDQEVYFSLSGGIILLSDSELYVEDGLKQADQEETDGIRKSPFQNLGKYFSAGAGINVFMNSSMFTDLLPLLVDTSEQTLPDLAHLFKWAAWDGDFSNQGVSLNGFLDYGSLSGSYVKVFSGQQPREVRIDGVIPARAMSFGMINLSNMDAYFRELEAYRTNTGTNGRISLRRGQLARMLGGEAEEKLKQLIEGEFAVVTMGYNQGTKETDGMIIAQLKSGGLCRQAIDQMMAECARFEGKKVTEYSRTYNIDRDKAYHYYASPAPDIASVWWGEMFRGIESRYLFVEDNYLILASSEQVMKAFIADYVHGSFIRQSEWYQRMRSRLSGKYSLGYFARIPEMLPFYQNILTPVCQEYLRPAEGNLSVFSALAMQWSNEGSMLYSSVLLSTEKLQSDSRAHLLWQTRLDARISMKPIPVENHVTGERELIVQDDNNTVYLINDAGRVLWRQAVDGKINSEIYQVDAFRNGKLQYLFSTGSKMYLIDRNGNPVGRYPVTFSVPSRIGISVFDYDGKREYRVFVPADDQKVYLYELDGTMLQGWTTPKADKQIVSKVQHFRVGNKDYIVFADQYRLYILDRKGRQRVRVSTVFDLRENTDLFLIRKDNTPALAFAGKGGIVNLADFDGKVQSLSCDTLSADFCMNAADVNGDRKTDFVFTDGGRFLVYDLNGRRLYRKDLDATDLDYPYIYRFTDSDVRVGLIDRKQNRMLLLTLDGTISPGFPITGDSPFSIVFEGEDGFFLFAGTDNGSVIKYRVQR